MRSTLCIIVPTLDSYKQLPKLIEGLKRQTSKNWRVIFVDGKSSNRHKVFLEKVVHEDSRFKVISQNEHSTGIFGAMNDGWREVTSDEWAVFWGSDDWPSNDESIGKILKTINSKAANRALLAVFSGEYVSASGKRVRTAKFLKNEKSNYIVASEFQYYLQQGLTPPHQATIFSPKLGQIKYNDNYRICADLDIFLRIGFMKDANILYSDSKIVTMENGGVSNKMTLKRLIEVAKTYKNQLRNHWRKVMLKRYINKIKIRFNLY